MVVGWGEWCGGGGPGGPLSPKYGYVRLPVHAGVTAVARTAGRLARPIAWRTSLLNRHRCGRPFTVQDNVLFNKFKSYRSIQHSTRVRTDSIEKDQRSGSPPRPRPPPRLLLHRCNQTTRRSMRSIYKQVDDCATDRRSIKPNGRRLARVYSANAASLALAQMASIFCRILSASSLSPRPSWYGI